MTCKVSVCKSLQYSGFGVQSGRYLWVDVTSQCLPLQLHGHPLKELLAACYVLVTLEYTPVVLWVAMQTLLRESHPWECSNQSATLGTIGWTKFVANNKYYVTHGCSLLHSFRVYSSHALLPVTIPAADCLLYTYTCSTTTRKYICHANSHVRVHAAARRDMHFNVVAIAWPLGWRARKHMRTISVTRHHGYKKVRWRKGSALLPWWPRLHCSWTARRKTFPRATSAQRTVNSYRNT